jgi:hypothetical protein
MGACTFGTTAKGKTAEEAFTTARKEAQYESGHGGYTGTIAEKTNFTMIECPAGMDPYEFAHGLIDKGDRRVDDKWGPAGCIKIKDGEFYFFGWASE